MTRRRLMKLLGATALVGGAGSMLFGRSANAYYSGPITDHFDGIAFFNPDGTGPKGPLQLLRWQLLESRATWPATFESPYPQAKPARQLPRDSARVTHIGHASFLIQVAGRNILIDPVWSKRASPIRAIGPKRVNPPGIQLEDLPRIDLVLVTHNHYDHMDTDVIGHLWQRDRASVITPLGNDTIIRGDIPGITVRPHDWHDAVDLGDGLRIHVEPTVHWSARGMRDRRHALWASFVIESPTHKIYCVGDSAFADGAIFRKVGEKHRGLDLALLPIGAYEPRWMMSSSHMNPTESLQALELCGAKAALGHHWGTFQLTNEAVDAPRDDLAAALAAKSLAPDRFQAMHPGQVHDLA